MKYGKSKTFLGLDILNAQKKNPGLEILYDKKIQIMKRKEKKMKRKELAIVGKLKTNYSFSYKKSGMEIVNSYEK